MTIRKLIGDVADDGWDMADVQAVLPEKVHRHFRPAFEGSLDAAKAMHDALLPGWIFDITNGSAFVMPLWDEPHTELPDQYVGEDDVDARAWLLAILRAMEGGRDG